MAEQGRLPTEPTGPSATRARFRPAWILGWLGVGAVATIALGIAWVVAPRTALLGGLATLAGACVTIALHHVVVTRDLGERTVPRPGAVDELAPFAARRRLIGGVLGGAAVVALAGVAGLLRFGTGPPTGTAWQPGVRLTTIEGSPVRPQDVPLGGVVTVWPQTAVGGELGAVMLIRLREAARPPTRLDAIVDDTLVAYSRLCTHAGCAVALYRDRDQALFCPCHQATFDARRGATPVSGPASHPLPQLPLALDDDGFLVATGDLSAPPGAVGGRA